MKIECSYYFTREFAVITERLKRELSGFFNGVEWENCTGWVRNQPSGPNWKTSDCVIFNISKFLEEHSNIVFKRSWKTVNGVSSCKCFEYKWLSVSLSTLTGFNNGGRSHGRNYTQSFFLEKLLRMSVWILGVCWDYMVMFFYVLALILMMPLLSLHI